MSNLLYCNEAILFQLMSSSANCSILLSLSVIQFMYVSAWIMVENKMKNRMERHFYCLYARRQIYLSAPTPALSFLYFLSCFLSIRLRIFSGLLFLFRLFLLVSPSLTLMSLSLAVFLSLLLLPAVLPWQSVCQYAASSIY